MKKELRTPSFTSISSDVFLSFFLSFFLDIKKNPILNRINDLFDCYYLFFLLLYLWRLWRLLRDPLTGLCTLLQPLSAYGVSLRISSNFEGSWSILGHLEASQRTFQCYEDSLTGPLVLKSIPKNPKNERDQVSLSLTLTPRMQMSQGDGWRHQPLNQWTRVSIIATDIFLTIRPSLIILVDQQWFFLTSISSWID